MQDALSSGTAGAHRPAQEAATSPPSARRPAEAPLCVQGDIANKTCNGTFNGEPVTFTVSLNLNEINYTYVNAPPTRAVADDVDDASTTVPAADSADDLDATPAADAGEAQTTAPAADNTNDSDATMTSVDNTSDSSESDETEGASRRGGVLAITALPPATLDAIMLETINVLSIFNFTAAEDTMTTPTVDFIVTQRDAIARTLTSDELQAYNTTLRAELCPAEICFDVSKLGFFDLDACVCNEQLQQLYQYSKDSRNSLGLSVAGAFVLLTGLVLALPAAASNLVNIRLRTELSSSMMPSPALSYSSASKAPVAV